MSEAMEVSSTTGSLTDISLAALAESTLKSRSSSSQAQLVDKLLNEGVADCAELIRVSRKSLEAAVAKSPNFNVADVGDVVELHRAARALQKERDPPPAIGARPRSRSRGSGGRPRGIKAEFDSDVEASDDDLSSNGSEPGSRPGGGKARGKAFRSGSRRINRGDSRRSDFRRRDWERRRDDRRGRAKPVLWTAVEQGDHKQVRQMLDDGVDPEERHENWTPLMKAAEEGHEEIMQMLIDIGVDLEAENRKGRTALSFAAAPSMGRPTKVGALRIMLQAGANTMQKDEYGNTAEERAARENRWEALKVFSEFRKAGKIT